MGGKKVKKIVSRSKAGKGPSQVQSEDGVEEGWGRGKKAKNMRTNFCRSLA